MFVVTIDQQDSRKNEDRVPGLISKLAGSSPLVGFERTVGDEVQALFDDAGKLVHALREVVRDGGWHIGVGIGDVESIPSSVREGRGSAFLLARAAVEAAKRTPESIAVRADAARSDGPPRAGSAENPDTAETPGHEGSQDGEGPGKRDGEKRGKGGDENAGGVVDRGSYGSPGKDRSTELAAAAEATCRLLASIVSERTDPQREVVAAFAQGTSGREVAAWLGISPQAVSQRRSGARLDLERSGWDSLVGLFGCFDAGCAAHGRAGRGGE